MVRMFASTGFVACFALVAGSIFSNAAPTVHRRQLGNLECNIDRGEIVFHVAQLAGTVNVLGNATDLMAAQNTTAADLQAMQEGAAGAGLAIKQILLALINNEPAAADLRDAVGGNLTSILTALQDLSSSNNETAAVLSAASQQLTNAALAGNGVVNNCK